jgi:hypothetical protein
MFFISLNIRETLYIVEFIKVILASFDYFA